MISSASKPINLGALRESNRQLMRPARWSERAHCELERDLMIGFFLLRRLIELHIVSRRTRDDTEPATGVTSSLYRITIVTTVSGACLWQRSIGSFVSLRRNILTPSA